MRIWCQCKTCKFAKSKFCLRILSLFALCNWICSFFVVVSFLSGLAIEEESMAEEEELSSRSNCSSTTLLPEWK